MIDDRGMPVIGQSAIVLFNANREAVDFALPGSLPHLTWQVVIDTNVENGDPGARLTLPATYRLSPHSLALLVGVR
jgi:glycogen operon protein